MQISEMFQRRVQKNKSITIFSSYGDFPTSSVQPTPSLLEMDQESKRTLVVGYLRQSIQSTHGAQLHKMKKLITKLLLTAACIHSQSSITADSSAFASHHEPLLSDAIVETIASYCVFYDKLLYSTRYEPENPTLTGIISYDICSGVHKALQLWCNNTQYFPRWNVTVLNRFKREMIFIGGSNVNENNSEYQLIAFYDLKSGRITTTDVDYVIGSNAKALVSEDGDLHIIGGQFNDKHIVMDLRTKQSQFIYDFGDSNPGIEEQGLLYNPLQNTLMMFGGYRLDESPEKPPECAYYDDFWMLDLNDALSSLSMTQAAKYLVDGYMQRTFLGRMCAYDVSLNDVIMRYLGETNITKAWNNIEKFRMIDGMRSFGAVLYECRVIIVLGGIVQRTLIDTIYYLDVNGSDGWKKSDAKCPARGMCNALLIQDMIHLLPYYKYTSHYAVHVSDILPKRLLRQELI